MIISYPVFKFMGMRSSLPLPSWYFQVLYMLKHIFSDIVEVDAILISNDEGHNFFYLFEHLDFEKA